MRWTQRLPPLPARVQPFGHWLLFVWRSFQRDQCLLRASALTYTTALSIVPFLAVAFSISKGLGFQNTEYIQEILLRLSAGREQVVEHIIGYINNTNVATLGSLGVGLLLLTVFTLLGTIEQSFNTIWGVQRQRSLTRKFSDYLSVTLVCPLLIIVATSFTASMKSSSLVQYILASSILSTVFIMILKLMPFFLVSAALFFMYLFITNARIKTGSTLAGAVTAGILWQVSQQTFISYQIGVSKYNAIYGSFAQLPLFLLWLYISWVIVLLGAEISYCLSHTKAAAHSESLGEFNLEGKERLGLAVILFLVRRFLAGEGASSPEEVAHTLGTPDFPVYKVLRVMEHLGFVIPVAGSGRVLVAVSPHEVPVPEFLRAFRAFHGPGEMRFTGPSGLDHYLREADESRVAGAHTVSLAELSRRVYPVSAPGDDQTGKT